MQKIGRLDLRERMRLAARAVARRLDPRMGNRPWFLLRGRGGIPVEPEHASWDLGDMGGRYLESLILARRMGIEEVELAGAEEKLRTFLFGLIGDDGLIHDPQTGKVDHPFSQGSALYGLLAWFKDSGNPIVRAALEQMISGLLKSCQQHGDYLVQTAAKLPQSCGSHLAGYQIWPAICFYEMTGYPDALLLAEGLTRWVMNDPVLSATGEITLALSWEGHIHSWLDTLAGCARTAKHSESLRSCGAIEGCRVVYDWVMRTNATRFGWVATFPGHGSCEACAISSAMRLALELASAGYPQYWNDVERFVRNHAVESQFRDLSCYADGAAEPVTPLLLGCFDSQSLPNGHLGTRGGEDVGNVEGCCLNGGMRALALAWNAAHVSDVNGVAVNLLIGATSASAETIDFQPEVGRVEIVSKFTSGLRVRIPDWLTPHDASVSVNGQPVGWHVEDGYFALGLVPAGARAAIEFPVPRSQETVMVGGVTYELAWAGDMVMSMSPQGAREPTYRDR